MYDRRELFRLAGLTTLALSLAACRSKAGPLTLDRLRQLASDGELWVGFIPYYEISEDQDPDAAPTGFLPDLFAMFCQSAKIPFERVKWRSIRWDSFASHVQNGSIQLSISGTFITEARKKAVAFTQPLFSLGNGAAVRRGDSRFSNLTDVMQLDRRDLKIAVVVGEQSAEFVSAHFKNARIISLNGPDLAAAPRAVEDGRADVAMSDQFILSRYLREHPRLVDVLLAKPFSVLPIAWAVNKSDTGLLTEIDAVLAPLIASPAYAALKQRYPIIPFAKDGSA